MTGLGVRISFVVAGVVSPCVRLHVNHIQYFLSENNVSLVHS